ncbi:MAG: hypothetical protein VR73_15405 [Gammaproteobacteria bacterium BRH_c0]|nr:MAG: hypothetical protein VR73_15405 [Gammaproteobacteria bacterium BRH_c0]
MTLHNAQKLLALLVFSSLPLSLAAEEPALFYRGDMDSNKVTAPNGAIVNGDYLKAMTEGPYGKVRVVKVREGVTTITGYANSNYTFIETRAGLIAVDAGSNIGQAREALRMIREITSKPVIAIIYTHHHYTGGAGEYVADSGETAVTVYGHPDLEGLLQSTTGYLGPKQQRSVGRILGLYLPHEGPDAVVAMPEFKFDDPALNANHHVAVNHPVNDGEAVDIDGVRAVFHHSVGDTRDSLIVHFPDLDLVVHNTGLLPVLAPLATLRGEYYRDPVDLIASIDKLRQLKAAYMIPSHGFPITDAQTGYDIATAHRDAYAYIYSQSIRAINAGLSPDEMARSIRLPPHLANHPWLAPTYVDNEYNVRAQYSGLVGWFSGESADLHPPSDAELGAVILSAFGSVDKAILSAQQAFDEKKYNLATKLLTYVLAVEPDNKPARQLKADSLRAMAQGTRSMQTRNYMLSQALDLEGAINWNQAPSKSVFRLPSVENILATPPGTYLKLLEVQIDPAKSAHLNKILAITFSDIDRSWGLHVRNGVAEISEGKPANADATLSMTRENWAKMVAGQSTIEKSLQSGTVNHTGKKADIIEVFHAFDWQFAL